MSENTNLPAKYDVGLDGQLLPPVSDGVLGGIEGLDRRLNTANSEQKLKILADAPNYQEAGINLLIETLNDTELTVRATAYQILREIESEKAQQAISQGLLLNPGDRIYSVYESVIAYNDWCYDLLIS